MGFWKANWEEARAHVQQWWDHAGLVLGTWGTGLPREGGSRIPAAAPPAAVPPAPPDPECRHRDPELVAARILQEMAASDWPADMLPVAWPDLGTVSLAPFFGAVPGYGPDNIWYSPVTSDPDSWPPLRFDPDHPEVRKLEALVRRTAQAAEGRYMVGMPAIVPNLDVLAELRGAEHVLLDLVDRPEWVEEKLREIDEAWTMAFDRLQRIIGLPDGSMAFGYFMLWGPGKTGLLQCDTSATFSPAMFERFVAPALRRECDFLDHSMFHLDGHQCLGHLEVLLDIETLDAVEWTPDPQVPSGGSPRWYDMYNRILAAGKSVWIANARPADVIPLLDAIGGAGVYLTVDVASAAELERIARDVAPYRGPAG